MEEAFNITAPHGLCEECLKKDMGYNQEFFWVYCPHTPAVAVMEVSEETGEPTNFWEVFSPVDPVTDWIRNRKKMKPLGTE